MMVASSAPLDQFIVRNPDYFFGNTPEHAFIQPDNRINAVVIRDIKENHAAYAKLVEQLDKPTGLVQISATIVDIDTNYNFARCVVLDVCHVRLRSPIEIEIR